MGVATIVGGVISLISNIFGGSNAEKEKKQQMQQAMASLANAKGVANEQLTMWQDQMSAWDGAFGSIQKNLSSYYNSLDASTISAQHIQNIEKEFARTQDMLQSEMASRGMIDSGSYNASQQAMYNELAKSRAEAHLRAPQEVVKQQQSYLQNLGMPQKGQILSGLTNSFSNLQNIYTNEANLHLGQAAQAGQAAAGAMNGVGSALGGIIGGISSLASNSQPTQATPDLDSKKPWISNYIGGY